MSIETLFESPYIGIIGFVTGTLFSVIVNHAFQKKLLNQQLDYQKSLLDHQLEFEKKLSEEDAHLREKIHKEWAALFTEFRNMVNIRLGRLQ